MSGVMPARVKGKVYKVAVRPAMLYVFHSDDVSCPFRPAHNYSANYTSFSSNFFLQVFQSHSLHSLYSGYSSYPVVLTYL